MYAKKYLMKKANHPKLVMYSTKPNLTLSAHFLR